MNPVYCFSDLEISIVDNNKNQFNNGTQEHQAPPTRILSKTEKMTPEIHDLFSLVEAIAFCAKDLNAHDDCLEVKFNVSTIY
ncbi:MAG: hypothetical protein MK102_17645 [Fuerstiella sp.]|nr:hypothetical protein [Fuerstiella sp.]